MIVVTFKGSPPPLIGRVRGIRVVSDFPGPSPALAISYTMNLFKSEKEPFLFVAAGAKINEARIWPVMKRTDFDWAAHVDRIGSLPEQPKKFNGIGRVSVETLIVRPTDAARRVLERWLHRIEASPGRDSINLAITLAEFDARLLHLPGAWAWRELAMRGADPMAEPVVEHDVGGAKPVFQVSDRKPVAAPLPKKEPVRTAPPVVRHQSRGPEVLWAGHLRDYSGFAKCNREILFRVSNSVLTKLDRTHSELTSIDEYTRARLDALEGTVIGQQAPFVRFFGPDFYPPAGRHRISYTMMETLQIHKQMVGFINDRFDELWVPTESGRQTFLKSGVKKPTYTMPLGVDMEVYRPWRRRKLPECRLISTSKAGQRGSPEGFVFITVGLPSFRKNFDFLADAFEALFAKNKNVHLVLGVTHSLVDWKFKLYQKFAKYKSRIWTLEGKYSEYELARIYSSCNAYATANLGEGFNLPMVEAAACGLPVIAPNHTSHPDVAGDKNAWLFETDGSAVHAEGSTVSPWYQGVEFPVLADRSMKALKECLDVVESGAAEVRRRTATFWTRIESNFTWDRAAARVVARLLEVQP